MIHYHHVDGGMSHIDKSRFLMGRHGLVSYQYRNQEGVAFEVCQSVVLDSGAYTAWKQGGSVDVEGFIEWCYTWYKHPGFDWALIPDVITGSESDNDALLAEWPSDIRGVPVWHMHESIGRLERLCNSYPVVALGSSGKWAEPGRADWWARMSLAMDEICDEEGRPPCRLHGLRMLDPEIFKRLPLSSADSMNAVRRGNDLMRFGMYIPPTAAQRSEIVASRVERFNSAPVWQRSPQLELIS